MIFGGTVLKQDSDLINPIKKWGCYFMSIYNLVEKITGVKQQEHWIILKLAEAMGKGLVDGETTVLNPEGLTKIFGKELYFIGKMPSNYTTNAGEYEILMFEKPGHTHFVLGDGKGGVLFDPLTAHDMGPYKLVSKRIFRSV
jgi:hypothetical protein